MEDIKKILDASDASDAVKQQALTLAFQTLTPIAYQVSQNAAGGQFLALLVELFKLLLPILLELLKPKDLASN